MKMHYLASCFAGITLLASCGSPQPNSSSAAPSSSSVASSSSVIASSSSSVASGIELIIQENTNGFCSVNGSVDSDNGGYTGAGFANATNIAGSAITWKVRATSAGVYRVDWRYANGTANDRSANVTVNGAARGSVSFSTTGAWDSWTEEGVSVNLVQGDNEIMLVATAAEGLANIDYVKIVGDSITPVACVPAVQSGDLNLADKAPGWASLNGGTSGGGSNLSNAITVSNMSQLQTAVSGSGAKVVLLNPGNYSGTLSPGANTTIMGKAPGVTINGNINISGSDKYNIVIRNLAVRGLHCSTYEECKDGKDAVYIGKGAHNVWLDHLDIADGQDGNCDVTRGADFVTISWTKFHYTYNKEHRFSNLIAGSDDEPESENKLNITYMNNWWGERVDQRQPRGRFGKIHMLNNYHNTGGSAIHGVGYKMAMIVENSYYDEPGRSIFKDMGNPQGWKGIGNAGSGTNLNASQGSVFTIPYSYTAMPVGQVKAAITSGNCGAGNSCQFAQ